MLARVHSGHTARTTDTEARADRQTDLDPGPYAASRPIQHPTPAPSSTGQISHHSVLHPHIHLPPAPATIRSKRTIVGGRMPPAAQNAGGGLLETAR